jgi:hypothetical protein
MMTDLQTKSHEVDSHFHILFYNCFYFLQRIYHKLKLSYFLLDVLIWNNFLLILFGNEFYEKRAYSCSSHSKYFGEFHLRSAQ